MQLIARPCAALLALAAVVFVIWDAFAWSRAANIVDSGFRELAAVHPSERPGGLFLDNDSYYWLSYATRIGLGETWRVRQTFADNAPYGRSVHWSQSVSWLLVGLGKARQTVTAESWTIALERAAVWLNPLLLLALSCGLGWALWRRVGALPAGFLMIYLVSLGDVGWAFQPLRPGHQSLHCLLGLAMVAAMALSGAGWVRVERSEAARATNYVIRPLQLPSASEARACFFISGVFAALSLWVSAVVTEALLLALFAGAISMAVFSSPFLGGDNHFDIRPKYWRLWGWTAGIGSFALYLVEYFPKNLSLFRLEVNGPLYSVAVIAMGEAMYQFLRARRVTSHRRVLAYLTAIGCVFIAALVPLAIFFGPQSWHALRDPEMRRFHYFIEEFYSIRRFARSNPILMFLNNLGFIPFFMVLAVGLVAIRKLPWMEWPAVWLSFAVTVGTLALGCIQIRWLGLYATMNAWLAVIVGVCAWRVLSDRVPDRLLRPVGITVCLVLLIQPVIFMTRRCHQVNDIIYQRTVPKNLVNLAMNKRLALAFRAAVGPGARVMAEPDFAPQLHYFADSQAVASFYWENLEGLHAATSFFSDSEGETARKIAFERGLTYVVVQEGNRLQNYFYYYATGKLDLDASAKTLAARLMGSEFALPEWLQTTPSLQRLSGQLYIYRERSFEDRWRIFEISRGQGR
ncbi:MAG TPA: hypothetical protein VGM62_12190 [Chthoniobacterales bacterium]|jgi:hypothetical protein